MWWEGDGGEAPREETPVDFDFIALLAKPKVTRERDGDASPAAVVPSILPRCHPSCLYFRDHVTENRVPLCLFLAPRVVWYRVLC